MAPNIHCGKLPPFSVTDWESVRQTFRAATPCVLGQAWLPAPEPDFEPAIVRTGWRGSDLLMFAELTDADIFSRATALNQKTWELGDAFEIFLRPVEQTAYAEFHITPNNQRLQLRIPNEPALRAAQKSGVVEPFFMLGDVIRTSTWVMPAARLWCAYAEIPAAAVCEKPTPLPGSEWLFSFSRYDYTRGRNEPVISSSSPHQIADFHRQQDWGRLALR